MRDREFFIQWLANKSLLVLFGNQENNLPLNNWNAQPLIAAQMAKALL